MSPTFFFYFKQQTTWTHYVTQQSSYVAKFIKIRHNLAMLWAKTKWAIFSETRRSIIRVRYSKLA